MGVLDLIYHLFNFVAPALVVSLVLVGVAPYLMPKRASAPGARAQAAINFVAGVLGLAVGLWFFGRDGKMASYALMLLLCVLGQASSARWGK